MRDLISRQAAIDAMAELQGRASTKAEFKGISKAWKRIKKLPPVQPERKTGRWIPQDHNHTHGNVSTLIYFPPTCSECGHAGDFNMNYCPNCGADMRGGA